MDFPNTPKFHVRVALSCIGIERGTDRQFILLAQEPLSETLHLPNRSIREGKTTGKEVVSLCRLYLAAAPDWYSVHSAGFIKIDEVLYLLYSTSMTNNIQTLNNSGWFALDALNEYKDRIETTHHLKLVTKGINSREST